MPTDYYTVLGLQKGASDTDIKQAYRRLARTHHPDVAADKATAETKFKEINEAYSILSDPQKREAYDRFGHAGVNGGGGGFGDMGGFGAEGINDIFDMFFGGGMRGAAGAAGQRRGGQNRGADRRYDLEISLEEAFTGVEREISFTHTATCDTCKGTRARPGTQPITCDTCGGSGMVQAVRSTPLGRFVTQGPCARCQGEGSIVLHPCETCGGHGRVERRRSMTITIPPGVDDGSRIRIANSGEAGNRGGAPGDLYVYLAVARHEFYTRDGMDLAMNMPVSFPLAALGGLVHVPTIAGTTVPLELHAGTQTGTRYRLRGHGMPNLRGAGFGDLYVSVYITVPERLTKRERELLSELADLRGESIDERSFFERVKDAFRPD